MKKWFIFLFGVVLVAGCGDIQWFPDAVKSSSTTGGTSGSGSNGSANGSTNGSNGGTSGGGSATDLAFVNKCSQAKGSLVTSNAILIVASGSIPASISVSGADSAYSINDTPFTKVAGLVGNGDSVTVRHTTAASGAGDPVVTTTLTIGGVTKTFKTTTDPCAAGTNTF